MQQDRDIDESCKHIACGVLESVYADIERARSLLNKPKQDQRSDAVNDNNPTGVAKRAESYISRKIVTGGITPIALGKFPYYSTDSIGAAFLSHLSPEELGEIKLFDIDGWKEDLTNLYKTTLLFDKDIRFEEILILMEAIMPEFAEFIHYQLNYAEEYNENMFLYLSPNSNARTRNQALKDIGAATSVYLYKARQYATTHGSYVGQMYEFMIRRYIEAERVYKFWRQDLHVANIRKDAKYTTENIWSSREYDDHSYNQIPYQNVINMMAIGTFPPFYRGLQSMQRLYALTNQAKSNLKDLAHILRYPKLFDTTLARLDKSNFRGQLRLRFINAN